MCVAVSLKRTIKHSSFWFSKSSGSGSAFGDVGIGGKGGAWYECKLYLYNDVVDV